MTAAIDDLSIGRLGVVVMDELHMIDDESRGYILELMATKLLSLEQKVQIIGESSQEVASFSLSSVLLAPRTITQSPEPRTTSWLFCIQSSR